MSIPLRAMLQVTGAPQYNEDAKSNRDTREYFEIKPVPSNNLPDDDIDHHAQQPQPYRRRQD
jgi:hypothetical protein